MALPNIFTADVVNTLVTRINNLTPTTAPAWGKMSVAEMLAHSNVTYEMAFEDKHKKPNGFVTFLLKLFVKNKVVNETPYAKNSQTSPQFLIKDTRDFETEKTRLINYLNKTQQLGQATFEGKVSNSFGALSSIQWNNLFYKHLDHHLSQFGV